MIKCVVFDVGNTLHVTMESSLMKGWNAQLKYLKKNGHSISLEEYRAAVGKAWKERLNRKNKGRNHELTIRVLKCLGIEPNQKMTSDLIRIFFDTRKKNKDPKSISPHAKQITHYLKNNGIKMGIISDSDASWARDWIRQHNIPIPQHLTLISNEIQAEKSSKKPFLLFLKKLKKEIPDIKPEDCLMVGDQEKDLNAKKAGYRTCLYNPKRKNIDHFKTTPDFEVADLLELKKIVSTLGS